MLLDKGVLIRARKVGFDRGLLELATMVGNETIILHDREREILNKHASRGAMN